MSPQMIGDLGNAAISLVGGTLATLYGFRKIGKKPGEDKSYDEKMKKLEKPLKILGPIVLLFGLFELARAFF